MYSKTTQKQIFHFMSESYPSFSHNGCQVKWNDGHAVEKLAWSKNAIDLQMCAKYYCSRRAWGSSKNAGKGEASKTSQSEKHISLSGQPPKESTNMALRSTSYIKKQWNQEENSRDRWNCWLNQQRAATYAAWEQQEYKGDFARAPYLWANQWTGFFLF